MSKSPLAAVEFFAAVEQAVRCYPNLSLHSLNVVGFLSNTHNILFVSKRVSPNLPKTDLMAAYITDVFERELELQA